MINEIISSISQNYSFSLNELKKYEYVLDWNGISQNSQIKWNKTIIDEFSNKLNFECLSENHSIPIDRELLIKYRDRWSWQYLTDNPTIRWTIELLEDFKDKWEWESVEFCGNIGLSLNTHLPWTVELIDKFDSKWFWGELSCNPSLPWTKELLLRYYDKWVWDGHFGHWGLSVNPSPIVEQLLIKYFPEKIDYTCFNKEVPIYSIDSPIGINELDRLVLDYVKEYGLEKLICCINITTL